MSGGFFDNISDRSKTPNLVIDSVVKRDFNNEKLKNAVKNAEWFISRVGVIADTKERFVALIDLVYGREVNDSVSFGLSVFGKTKELSLLVNFSNGEIVYKLTALSRPDFGPRIGGG